MFKLTIKYEIKLSNFILMDFNVQFKHTYLTIFVGNIEKKLFEVLTKLKYIQNNELITRFGFICICESC